MGAPPPLVEPLILFVSRDKRIYFCLYIFIECVLKCIGLQTKIYIYNLFSKLNDFLRFVEKSFLISLDHKIKQVRFN